MAKKSRKTPAGKPRAEGEKPAGEDIAEDAADEETETLPAEPSKGARGASAAVSPLLRAQEIELEVGLGVMGTLVGVLTGYGQGVPLDAPAGNLVGAVEGGLIGAMLGYSLGRTLFLSVRAQWTAWIVLIALVTIGVMGGGLAGGVVGAGAGTFLAVTGRMGGGDESAAAEPVTSGA